jgi:hypothetical protein
MFRDISDCTLDNERAVERRKAMRENDLLLKMTVRVI